MSNLLVDCGLMLINIFKENLIQNHYKVPSFESNLTLPLGSSITSPRGVNI